MCSVQEVGDRVPIFLTKVHHNPPPGHHDLWVDGHLMEYFCKLLCNLNAFVFGESGAASQFAAPSLPILRNFRPLPRSN